MKITRVICALITALLFLLVLSSRSWTSLQVAQEKAPERVEPRPSTLVGTKVEQPGWKVGYEWRYAWKGPQGSGTFTKEVVREDTFEGTPSYVVRVGKNEDFVAKAGLGLLGRMEEYLYLGEHRGEIISKPRLPDGYKQSRGSEGVGRDL